MFSVRRRAAAAPGATLVAARAALPSVSGSLATPAAAATRVAAVTAATAVTRSLSSAVTRAVNARPAVAASGPTSSIAAIARNARIANRVLAPGAACTAGGLTFSPRFYAAADYPDHFVVRFPALSPTMTDGNMKEWTVSVGEEVTNGDVVCSIETDKAVLEFESPEDGFVAKILVDEGSTGVQVGEPMLIIAEAEEDVGAFDGFTAADAGGAEGGDAPEPAAEEPAAPAAAAPAAADATPAAAPSSGAAAPAASGERVFASPLARKTAGEKGVNIGGVSPTGPNNRVVAADVLEAAASGSAAPAASAAAPSMGGAAGGDWEDIPLTNMRRVIAQRLTESKQTVPHFYVTVECEIDSLMAVRKQLNDEADGNYKLSVNDFVVKASALALREVPEVNSAWMGDFIRKHNTVDISIAVDTGDGLITPIVTDADSRGLSSISSTVKDLAGRARDNKLLPQEYQGGTFSISNLGMFGVKHFTAIINPPQACILAVGSAEKRLVPDATAESGHSTANVMAVTLSCDHRVVDGARGAKWLQAFKRHIENPLTMLL